MEEFTDRDLEDLLIAVEAKFWKEKAKQKYGFVPRRWLKLADKLRVEIASRKSTA